MKKFKRKHLINLGLIIIGSLGGLLLAEGVLRLISPHKKFYTILPKVNTQIEVELHDLFPGLESVIDYNTNKEGHRSRYLFEEGRFNILALGGSTMECLGVGDKYNWTYILEDLINATNSFPAVSIGNMGRSGLNASHHAVQLQYLPEQLKKVDMVMVLVGINDFMRALYLNEDYLHYDEDPMVLRRAFVQFPRKRAAQWYQRTELWMHLRDIKYHYFRKKNSNPDNLRNRILELRKSHEKAKLKTHLPNLDHALKDYENKIDEVIKICQEQSLELVLVTQPVLWKENMSPQEMEYTSLAELMIDNSAYEPKALKNGMEQFNEVLRQKGQEESVYTIDLEAVLPSDTTVFHDYCHFNKTGTPQVAKIIYDKLSKILMKKTK